LFDRLWQEVNSDGDLRSRYRAWKESDEKQDASDPETLTADEMLDIEIESKVKWDFDPVT
jgi:hypothetical protein